MKKHVAALLLSAAFASPAAAQTAPAFSFGTVLTPAQWTALFASKQDYLGAPPLLITGGVMTGQLDAAASTTAVAGLNLAPGVAPTSPNNGDIWTTGGGLFVQINGATVGPLTPGTSAGFAGTSPITVSFPSGIVTYACATCGLTGNPLSQFSSTTSAQLAGIISDETGSGSLVFGISPSLTTPSLGVASATSINKLTITPPASAATLTIANGKTHTVNNSLAFSGTDSTTFTFPGASDTVLGLAAAQSPTNKTISGSTNVLGGVTMTLGSDATGDVYYRASGGLLTRLGIGTSGNVLTVSGGLPSWQPGSAAGSINVATTTITGTCSNAQILFDNSGISGCENLASTLTAGNAISITGTTNPTIAANYTGGNAITITGASIAASYTGGAGITITGASIAQSLDSNMVDSGPSGLPASPTTANNSFMGFGSVCHITPKYSTRVRFTITGTISENSGTSLTALLRYGTGTAPANSSTSVVGTQLTPVQSINGAGSTGVSAPMSLSGIASGLSTGTAYWFDAFVALTNGGMSNPHCDAHEVL